MNTFSVHFESDLENPVPSHVMRELLDQNLYACVSDAVLTFLGDLGEADFYEDVFTLETDLSKEQFINKANSYDLFNKLGIKIRAE